MATNEPHDVANQLVGLYRTGITPTDRLVKTTVGRQHLLDGMLGKLRGMRRSIQHCVFIGPRGIGKTHLLSLIECAVESDPALALRYTIVRFSEESNRVVSFADFLLGIVEILCATADDQSWCDLYERVKQHEDDDTVVDTILPAINAWHKTTQRRLLIMLENLDVVFTQKIKNPRCIHQFRSLLMGSSAVVLIGTAPSFFSGLTDLKHPLYDFFDIQVLEELDEAHTLQLIRTSLEWDARGDLLARFDELVPKVKALHYMTGGNPRLILILYGLIARENVLDVKAQFHKLLDEITPFYQDRLKDVAPHERALLETMALMRTSYEPKTPANIARSMRKPQRQISVLLKRMLKAGYLSVATNLEDKRSRLYRIKEGFFDLWLAMNESRTQRARLPFLVEFFERWYSQPCERERKRDELRNVYCSNAVAAPHQVRENVAETLAYLSDVGDTQEKTEAKLALATEHIKAGDKDHAQEILAEIKPLSSGKPVFIWMTERIEEWAQGSASQDVRQQIQHMIEYWHTQRVGDLETAARLAHKLAFDFSQKGLHELNIELMDDALAHVQDQTKRGKLLVLRGRSQRMLHRMEEALESLGAAVKLCRASKDLRGEGSVLNEEAIVLNEMGLFEKAENAVRRALEIAEKMYGPNHHNVATALNNLAQVFLNTNRLKDAEPLMRRALLIAEKSYGPDHPDVAICLNHLVSILRAMDRLAEAEPLMRRALAIAERNYGLDNPNVASSLNNLALLLLDTNRLADAEPLMRRAFAIAEVSYGPDHPHVAVCLNNLALLLQATNRVADAEPLTRRALAVDEKSYGSDHPHVAVCLNNLAQVLQATHRPKEAELLMRRALAIDEKSYGPNHPTVAIRLNNLAQILQATNRLKHAEPLMRRALAIGEKSCGPDHASVAIRLNNLALLLQATDRLAEAEPLMRRALAIFEKSYGADHPHVANCLNNLASLLRATDRLAEAESLMRRAMPSQP